MPKTVAEIIEVFEDWAPASTAESYDNVGLQLGSPADRVSRALVSLDLTPDVADEAVDLGVDLVVTHHPPIFKPVRAIRADDLVGSMLLRLARSGIALVAAHTNLDAARGGVSYALADVLGLRDLTTLSPSTAATVKLATFVPASHVDAVAEAMSSSGGGRIGDYTECAFQVTGSGRFRVPPDGNPAIGAPGSRAFVEEVRLEMEVERARIPGVVRALVEAHPYEEVAYDVVHLENPSTRTGMGVVGDLAAPRRIDDFVGFVAERLDAGGIRFSADSDAMIRRVAVCGGAGSSLVGAARRAGADVLVTGDVSYHRYFEAMMPDGSFAMALIDAGHYETERPAEQRIIERMALLAKDVEWIRTSIRTNPVRYVGRDDR